MSDKEIKEILSGCDGSCLAHMGDPHYCKDTCEVRELLLKLIAGNKDEKEGK